MTSYFTIEFARSLSTPFSEQLNRVNTLLYTLTWMKVQILIPEIRIGGLEMGQIKRIKTGGHEIMLFSFRRLRIAGRR